MRIRDLIYFDANKASSIWSQINQGLNESVTTTIHQESGTTFGGKIGAQGLGAEGKRSSSEKGSTTEKLIPHHELLAQLEEALESGKLVTDANGLLKSGLDVSSVRESAANMPYVRATGKIIFEDYPRLKALAEDFHQISGFLNRCGLHDVKLSQKAESELKKIESLFIDLKYSVDEKDRAKTRKKIAASQKALEAEESDLEPAISTWLVQGITDWIERFAPHRRLVRMNAVCGEETLQFVGSLKLECFVDQDLDHVLFAYGERPAEDVSIFGLVTNIPLPPKRQEEEIEDESDDDEDATMSSAFETIFESMSGVYQTMNPVYFPRMALHPIALYRDIRSSNS